MRISPVIIVCLVPVLCTLIVSLAVVSIVCSPLIFIGWVLNLFFGGKKKKGLNSGAAHVQAHPSKARFESMMQGFDFPELHFK